MRARPCPLGRPSLSGSPRCRYNPDMPNSRAPLSFRLARGIGKELAIGGILPVLALAGCLAWPSPYTFGLAAILVALFVLLLVFFRDPERLSPQDKASVVAPADGRVVEVVDEHEPRFLGGQGLKIAVFMSLLDVHVNRSPGPGRVVLVEHASGQHLQAFRAEASETNEHNLIGLEGFYGRVLVKQIAGIMARRIVCWAEPGQHLRTGDRLGIIKFGSRVELYLPLGAEALVQPGDRTRAGVTVVARWKPEGPH